MRKGIFSDQSGQDTLEYVAMGLMAMSMGAIIMVIMKKLLLDCLLVDVC